VRPAASDVQVVEPAEADDQGFVVGESACHLVVPVLVKPPYSRPVSTVNNKITDRDGMPHSL
jgi:hypothetical protein